MAFAIISVDPLYPMVHLLYPDVRIWKSITVSSEPVYVYIVWSALQLRVYLGLDEHPKLELTYFSGVFII